MSSLSTTATDRVASPPSWRTPVRVALLAVAFFFISAGFRAFDHMQVDRARTYTTTWGSWLWWMALLTFAGLAFGLAAMLPSRLRFRPGRALLLGVVPLLILIYLSMQAGPGDFVSWANQHLRFITNNTWLNTWLALQDIVQTGFICSVLLGVAIAAGFDSDSR